jgi:excisionase family DNA binding protein
VKRTAQTNPEDPILHLPEAAQYLRVSRSTLYRMVSARSIEFSRVGRVLKFRRSALDAMLTAKNVGGDADPNETQRATKAVLAEV